MAFSAHAHRRWPKWFKTRSHWQKFRSSIQIRAGRTLLWTRGILPKSTTMAVSAIVQWQIRQKKSRSENMVHLLQVHIQKRIVMYNFQLYTRHTHTHHDVKLTSNKSKDEALGASPTLGYAIVAVFWTCCGIIVYMLYFTLLPFDFSLLLPTRRG